MFMQAAFGGVPEAQLKMATLAYEGRTEGGKREAASAKDRKSVV